MSCPNCRRSSQARPLWLAIVVTAVVALAYLQGGAGPEPSEPASTSTRETHQ
jgi:hypothetical protein